ncbi:hypothetical protein GCM10027160_48410 [Streptomyces calidiresistens]
MDVLPVEFFHDAHPFGVGVPAPRGRDDGDQLGAPSGWRAVGGLVGPERSGRWTARPRPRGPGTGRLIHVLS